MSQEEQLDGPDAVQSATMITGMDVHSANTMHPMGPTSKTADMHQLAGDDTLDSGISIINPAEHASVQDAMTVHAAQPHQIATMGLGSSTSGSSNEFSNFNNQLPPRPTTSIHPISIAPSNDARGPTQTRHQNIRPKTAVPTQQNMQYHIQQAPTYQQPSYTQQFQRSRSLSASSVGLSSNDPLTSPDTDNIQPRANFQAPLLNQQQQQSAGNIQPTPAAQQQKQPTASNSTTFLLNMNLPPPPKESWNLPSHTVFPSAVLLQRLHGFAYAIHAINDAYATTYLDPSQKYPSCFGKSDPQYWVKMVEDYFMPDEVVFRLGMTKKSSGEHKVHVIRLPSLLSRFFHTIAQSNAVLSFHYPCPRFPSVNTIISDSATLQLTFPTSSPELAYVERAVTLKGHFKVVFSTDLKISEFEFLSTSVSELHGSPDSCSPSLPASHPISAPVSYVTDWNMPLRVVRMLEILEIFDIMRSVMDSSLTNNISPRQAYAMDKQLHAGRNVEPAKQQIKQQTQQQLPILLPAQLPPQQQQLQTSPSEIQQTLAHMPSTSSSMQYAQRPAMPATQPETNHRPPMSAPPSNETTFERQRSRSLESALPPTSTSTTTAAPPTNNSSTTTVRTSKAAPRQKRHSVAGTVSTSSSTNGNTSSSTIKNLMIPSLPATYLSMFPQAETFGVSKDFQNKTEENSIAEGQEAETMEGVESASVHDETTANEVQQDATSMGNSQSASNAIGETIDHPENIQEETETRGRSGSTSEDASPQQPQPPQQQAQNTQNPKPSRRKRGRGPLRNRSSNDEVSDTEQEFSPTISRKRGRKVPGSP